MTTANKITILRIFLVPVFVAVALYYGKSVREGNPDETLRIIAIAVFAIAAASDGLDGFIARRFNQQSKLGVILDPIADKGLMISALVVLSVGGWPETFPLWFPILVITRDVLSIAGAFVINHVAGEVQINPHWTGKLATFFQIVAIGWVMLRFPHSIYPTIAAGVFTFASACVYFAAGLRQIHQHEESVSDGHPE